jgi:hypothetical protein
MKQRRDAHVNGEWVREAVTAHEEKKKAVKEAA